MPILKIRILNLKIQISNFSRKMGCSSNSGLHLYRMFPTVFDRIPDNKLCHWKSSIYGSKYYFGCCWFFKALLRRSMSSPFPVYHCSSEPIQSFILLCMFKCFHFLPPMITFSTRTTSQRGLTFREYVN